MNIYTKITNYLSAASWWQYYYAHALIALALQVGVAWAVVLSFHTSWLLAMSWGTSISFAVYLSRKETEYEKNTDPSNRWDWPGLVWPTMAIGSTLIFSWWGLLAPLAFALIDYALPRPAALPWYERFWRSHG